jgi:hypothetical protein
LFNWLGDYFNKGNHFRALHDLFRACFIREDLYLLTALSYVPVLLLADNDCLCDLIRFLRVSETN